jgi:hypothetical protein
MAQLLTDYAGAIETRLQRLLESGIARERISMITMATCAECHGAGCSVAHDLVGATYKAVYRECSTCPGLCVDGAAVRAVRER